MNKYKYARVLLYLLFMLHTGIAWSAGNTPSSLKLLSYEASDGDDGAQLLYGLAYLRGQDGLKPNAKKAIYWLRRSARLGNAYAQFKLGNCYAKGLGVVASQKQAVRWWHEASQGDNPEAQYLLGKAYLDGTGASKDPAQAIYWLTKSAEQGNKDAQYLIGKMYYEGYSVAQDKSIATDWLSRAASLGHVEAINLLTIIKDFLNTGTLTYQHSAEVLINKAKQGDPQAEYELGIRYESGAWDVNQNNKQALIWITKAAHAGNHIAMQTLADIYKHGDLDLKPDAAKAAEWQKKAGTYR